MQQSKDDLSPRKLVISDLQKQITPTMIENFLKATKSIDKVTSFRKEKDKIYLQFLSEDDGRQFIQEHNQRSQIMARKFNIYWACFEKITQVNRFEANGVTESKLRNLFDQCKKYGACKFNLKYEGQKLTFNCIIQFLNLLDEKNVQQLKSALASFEVKLRPQQQFGDFDKFRCSIELSHFYFIIDIHLSENEEQKVITSLEQLVKEATQEQISGVELHTFEHQKKPAVKAYFKFKDNQTTFNEFEKLRILLLSKPEQMRCRMFYFQDEANSFRTLFILNILNNNNLPEKHLEHELISAFRKINPNVVQILLRGRKDVYTGKIYFRQEDNGRQFLVDYPSNRKHIYHFFEANKPIKINVFQSNKEQKKTVRLENNAQKLMTHFHNQKKKNEHEVPQFQNLIPPSPPFQNYHHTPPNFHAPYPQYSQQPQYYNKHRQANNEKSNKVPKYRPKEEKPANKTEKLGGKFELSEGDFPSIK